MLLTILYVLVVVPIGLLRRGASGQMFRQNPQPVWQSRTVDATADPLQDARQQF